MKQGGLLRVTRVGLPANATFALKAKHIVFISPISIFKMPALFASVWMCFASFSHQQFYYTCSNKPPLKRRFILILSSCIPWAQIKVTKERRIFSLHMGGIALWFPGFPCPRSRKWLFCHILGVIIIPNVRWTVLLSLCWNSPGIVKNISQSILFLNITGR